MEYVRHVGHVQDVQFADIWLSSEQRLRWLIHGQFGFRKDDPVATGSLGFVETGVRDLQQFRGAGRASA